MELDGARVLVAGAGGEVGHHLVDALHRRGARLALAGRDLDRLRSAAEPVPGDAPLLRFDLRDPASCARVVGEAEAELGGLDVLIVATGAVAFGAAEALDPDVASALLAVNAAGPMALIAAAVPLLPAGGAIAALSAVVAEHPTAGMAAYSASKAALSAYLVALRRELRRRKVAVLDVRPPHLDTGFASRALAGAPPALPEPYAAADVATAVCDALAAGTVRELAWDLRARALVTS